MLREAQAESGAIIASIGLLPVRLLLVPRRRVHRARLVRVRRAGPGGPVSTAGPPVVARRGQDTIERAIADRAAAGRSTAGDVLDARYRADGSRGDEPWPNFQLDGARRLALVAARVDGRSQGQRDQGQRDPPQRGSGWRDPGRRAPDGAAPDGVAGELAGAVRLAARYLAALWDQPSYDCWEEGDGPGARQHAGRGLRRPGRGRAAARRAALAGSWPGRSVSWCSGPGVSGGRLRKHLGSELVDGSLVWAGVPFGLLASGRPADDGDRDQAIAIDLTGPTGGIYRYLGDYLLRRRRVDTAGRAPGLVLGQGRPR